MSISSLLFTSRDALMSHQMAIDITGGNIANVDTPGYSRQRTDLKAIGSVSVTGGTAQIGVLVSRIERIYDNYLESQIVEQNQNTGYSDTMLAGLQNIEVMLDDTQGGGINDQLNAFWSAWENLSNAPTGKVERSALLSAGENLVDSLASYRRNLDTINTDMNRNIADAVTQINSKVDEIKDLNLQIMATTGDKGDSNDLMDKRTQALKELGSWVNINHFDNADGTINIYLANGDPLLQGVLDQNLSVKVNTDGHSDVFSYTSATDPVNSSLTKGKLGAYSELQNSVVPEYMGYLDDFAQALADRVNEIHSSGFDAYKNTGVDFFEIPDSSNKAGTIRVNPAISADVNRIAASTSVTGDGENASKLAAVQNELLMNSNTSTLNSFMATVVGRIGGEVSTAKTNSDHQTMIMNHLETQRESVSGVSIDEEMIRLIKYQMGYNAAGRLASVVQEMLDTLMDLVK
jgi:flagellar hook-associated protein 1